MPHAVVRNLLTPEHRQASMAALGLARPLPASPRNPTLRDATHHAAREALELVDEYLSAGGEAHEAERDQWVRRGDVFVRERLASPVWEAVLHDLRPTMQQRGSTKALLAALRADPVIAPQLDTMVGIGLHQRRIQAFDILEGLVRHLASSARAELRFDEAEFQRAYEDMESSFYSASVPVQAVAPLRGFRSDEPRVFLGSALEIAPLLDEEVVDCIRAGALAPSLDGTVQPPRFAVRALYQSPKVVGDAPRASEADAPARAAEERVDEVLRALAAFQPGRVGRAAVVHRSPMWFLRGALRTGPAPPPLAWGRAYHLAKAEAAAFPHFWAALQSPGVRARSSLGVALRRFQAACAQARAEDRLIDLLVCADALALNVAHDSSDPREMRFRLALRSGFAMAHDRARREFDRHIRRAYVVRDAVVHGSPPPLPANPDGSAPSLDAFLDTTEGLLRDALQRAVALAAVPDLEPTQALDWRAVAQRVALPPA
jgi:hypothetical protein